MENESRSKSSRSRAIRRLVIWYRRNSAVTTLVDTATNSASAAGNVVSSAGSMARSTLEPLVFDPLRRLQGGQNHSEKSIASDSATRLWVAVDGMGGDLAPVSVIDGVKIASKKLPNIEFNILMI